MRIKNLLKNSFLFPVLVYIRYIMVRYVNKRRFSNIRINRNYNIKPIDKGVNFFGYYNLSPENSNGDVLYLKVQNEKMRGSLFVPAEIMLKKENGEITKLAEAKAWNWQQGCMLQWLGDDGAEILYNDYDSENDCYISKVIDTTGNLLRTYNYPVNNVSKNGDYALGLNYKRLAIMRPDYGYFNHRNTNLLEDKNDGICYIDLKSGEVKLIITLDNLKNLSWSDTMKGAMHKVNHIDINLSGNYFMFLHRWKGPKGRFMRLISAYSDGSGVKILNGDLMTSHSCWLNDNEILSFCRYKDETGYFIFNFKNDEVKYFSEKMSEKDGHPSISTNKKWIITDTYPDISRFSSLFLYNIENNTMNNIGIFHQPFRYKKEMRIDLHPKWGKDGNTLFFESGHNGKRQLIKLKLLK